METSNNTQILIYRNREGDIALDVRLEGEDVWLTQAQIAILFGKARTTITEHIAHIFEEGELDEKVVCRNFRHTTPHGALESRIQERDVKHYNLDMVISVGYRVKSLQGIHFRQWATQRLREYIVKGFSLDDQRLKNLGGGNYWKELLERIRDIRSSEKVMYRQVLDLYATASDYDPKSEASLLFFKTVQNKLHYAAHGHTASEIIYMRVGSDKPFAGLTNFNGPFPTQAEAMIAKNYLSEQELRILNNLVSAYFDLAEISAVEQRVMCMADHLRELDNILQATGRPLLKNAGKVSHKVAKQKAKREIQQYGAKMLSPVEKAYLSSITTLEKTAKKASKQDTTSKDGK